jgi:hypothetical protein
MRSATRNMHSTRALSGQSVPPPMRSFRHVPCDTYHGFDSRFLHATTSGALSGSTIGPAFLSRPLCPAPSCLVVAHMNSHMQLTDTSLAVIGYRIYIHELTDSSLAVSPKLSPWATRAGRSCLLKTMKAESRRIRPVVEVAGLEGSGVDLGLRGGGL